MKYYSFIILVFLTSCQDVKRPEAPENLISERQMAAIMTDAYLMKAARSIDIRTVRSEGILLDSIIYSKFDIDSLQFAKSNAFYTNNLNTYNDIMLQVEQQLITEKAKRDTLYELFKADKASLKRQDSIYKAKIDSLGIRMPELSKDSLKTILDIENTKTIPVLMGITEEGAISQDSLL